MRKFIEILLLCALLSGCAASGGLATFVSDTREAVGARLDAGHADAATQARFDEALGALRSGERARAEKLFEALSEERPKLAGPHLNLALIRLADGRLAEAEASARKARSVSPHSAQANNALGIVLRRQGKFLQAEEAYLDAVADEPQYAFAWRNLGVLYDLYLQRPHKALSAYQKFQALVAEPDKEVALWISDLSRRFGETPRAAAVTSP